ncbi:Uu.00g135080.m01.CDS01 [Anthostomella pinea]|uniref:Uu.00g135080.m01.CDS01 n=1 Tax=Anthostomella pinea TaxID=933095 RepID=A0AAI8VP21_9PEZI|nr:Uu.00g135080.m01.CDS01 [Anthostomella pinea]
MSEYRHVRSGSLNIPSQANAMSPVAQSHSRFDGPRSPPNTSHVPCKFFRQGACQAGSACPFSHDLGSAAETVCKYFAKGNCKFGPKCANVHVLADGRRINYSKSGITIGQPLHLGNRVSPAAYNNSNSALTNSFMRGDSYGYPVSPSEPYQTIDRRPSLENVPTIDTTYSHTSSQYGSPREEDPSRLGLGLSPVAGKGLSVLDAPLPASFDSNGISNAALYPGGPWPSSVPSQFGIESPSPSLNAAKESRTSEALKLLHHSAFGSNERLSATVTGSSPPTQPSDEYFGRRQMHSSRYAKPKMLSSSAPRAIVGAIDRDWESEFPFTEEDYLPDNLKELLTPAEKARRGSRATDDEVSGLRTNGTSGTGTPNAEPSSKIGSPLASSPSRWGPLFQRQHEEHEAKKHAIAASAGVFGHVGSPLRQSSLSADVVRPHTAGRPGSIEGLSVLTQQLQRTRIDGNGSGGESPLLHPHAHVSRPSNGRNGERHISSGSVSSSARYTTPIGEEDGEFVFSMDEDGDRDTTIRARQRTSGVGTVMGAWGSSYAGVAAGPGKKDDGGARVVDRVGGR